jgi:lipase chaperone LimK
MARCSRCGGSVGLLSNMCNDCKKLVEEEQRAEQERLKLERKRKQQLAIEREAELERLNHEKAKRSYISYRCQLVEMKADELQEKLSLSEKIVLYKKVYLPVDSRIVKDDVVNSFDIDILKRLGLDGWDIVAVVPRTFGIALTNVSFGSSAGETWGAGVGGNVVGVHIIVQKEISTQIRSLSKDLLIQYIDKNLNELLLEDQSQKLADLWEEYNYYREI